MRRIVILAAKIMIKGALLYFALRETNFAALSGRINLASAGWLSVSVAIAVLQVGVSAVRWHLISGDCGASLSVGRAMRYNIIGSFFNQTLPSSMGGDAVRMWLLAGDGAGWRSATYSVFLDRAIGLMALAVFILVSLPWSLNLIDNAEGRLGLAVLDLVAVVASLVFLLVHRRPFEFLTRIWVVRHLRACSLIVGRVLFNRRRGPVIAAISVLIHVLAVVIAWCAARAINAPADFVELLLLIPPVTLIAVIPISIAGWGLREASMGLAFSFAGLGASEGVNVSLLFGAVYFTVGVAGGLVWALQADRAAKVHAPAGVPD
ncbi:lysylphosphatidylglycerol synthase transmembrane domain-containing protein [Rhodopseudomonas sp.]|uniref:lysylphosphatidylglycerol synthase transmembrane domain-containing protein n=1 Tax=Rhodopseudomonas sp. TaxID=1078 RepID=UPI003B3BAF51